MILAKCCHDMDILLYLIGSKCKTISSMGDLTFFKKENAPEGAPARCLDGCPEYDTCPYCAPKLYLHNSYLRSWGLENLFDIPDTSDESILKALETNQYGRCVFQCDNDVVDHQSATIEFENGVRGILIPEDSANLNVRKMHVDIGAKNAQEAEKKVRPGDFFAPVHRIAKHGTKVCGTALDGRLACAILIKTAASLADNKDDIYFAFTGRQTVGFKGACAAVYNVCPHIAISVGITPEGACKSGAGAAIKLKDAATVCDRELAFTLEDTAKGAKIPYQLEINTHTASEAVSLQTTGAGAAVGAISVAAKYLHTSAETAYLSDAEGAVKILCAYLGGNK
jgi:hypothetical protein